MAERTFYVLAGDNCKFESMSKEQILAAITQAVSTGEIKDVDTGFVTKIKELNKNKQLSFWVGTTAEYNAIETKLENCFYITTDDDTLAGLQQEIESLQSSINSIGIDVAELKKAPKLSVTPNKVLYQNNSGIIGDISCIGVEKYSMFAVLCNYMSNPEGIYRTEQIMMYLKNPYSEDNGTVVMAQTSFVMDRTTDPVTVGNAVLYVKKDSFKLDVTCNNATTRSVTPIKLTGVI